MSRKLTIISLIGLGLRFLCVYVFICDRITFFMCFLWEEEILFYVMRLAIERRTGRFGKPCAEKLKSCQGSAAVRILSGGGPPACALVLATAARFSFLWIVILFDGFSEIPDSCFFGSVTWAFISEENLDFCRLTYYYNRNIGR